MEVHDVQHTRGCTAFFGGVYPPRLLGNKHESIKNLLLEGLTESIHKIREHRH